ncbi:unnamed protein product [Rangifer tarandus platyrhynchus]|uniref:Uncharacterized protein n=2 Tax=Rangifer tarandus platyrhynchus TaxID=3082113 RepID=A0AC59YSY9_RANTA|nr:unnamed protein product [Rangifer tarandus platyrhynchus]
MTYPPGLGFQLAPPPRSSNPDARGWKIISHIPSWLKDALPPPSPETTPVPESLGDSPFWSWGAHGISNLPPSAPTGLRNTPHPRVGGMSLSTILDATIPMQGAF